MSERVLFRIRPGGPTDTRLSRLAFATAALCGWRRYGFAFLLGVTAAAAMPPTDFAPVLLVSFPGLLWLDTGSASPAASFALGWSFGFGFFVAGLYWIAAALFVDLQHYWWLVPFAGAGLPALFALYIAIALGTVHLAVRWLRLTPAARVFAFACAWSAAEWARGHAFSGFPWNLIGYAWSGGFPGGLAILQSVAWVGIYGLGFVTVLAASLPALLPDAAANPLSAWRRAAPVLAAGLLVVIPAAAGAWRLARAPAVDSETWLRLVQPSIPQTLKWNAAAAMENFRLLLTLSRGPSAHRLAAVVWPEAAVSFFLGREPDARRAIAAVAPQAGYVITGALRANPPPAPIKQVWNSLEAVDAAGAIVAHYDKVHLVPFGEYVPFRDVLPIDKITHGTIDLTAGRGPRTLRLPGLPAFASLICYEAIFPRAVVDAADRPDWLLNITNDAWFGRTSGPFQHFAMARTRAVEEGLPLVRVANNGVSGVIDAQGRVRLSVALDAVGHVDAVLPAPAAAPVFARLGDWPFLALLLAGLVGVALGIGRPAKIG